MKVAITGNTRGLGAALDTKFSELGYKVKGYSLSQGWDIGDEATRSRLIDDVADVDIFVNNAYHPLGQLELLKMFALQYSGKTILNISSKSALIDINIIKNQSAQQYIAIKQALNSVASDIMLSGVHNILNVLPGVIDTTMGSIWPGPKLQADFVADKIISLLAIPEIQQVVIDTPGIDYSVYNQL